MSYDHRTDGWEKYEAFKQALVLAGIDFNETYLSETHPRGAALDHGCYCAYALDSTPVGPVVETTTEYSDEEFTEVLHEALEVWDHGQAWMLRKNYLTHGRVACSCCLGTCGHIQALRIGRFTRPDGTDMVVEEYLEVDDLDCDGVSIVSFAVYQDGKRPNLTTRILAA